MNATFYLTKDYENETAFRPQKNKPNSNPKQTQTNPTCSELVEPISNAED